MGVTACYCEHCNRRIPQEELEEGNIAKTANGYLCAECAKELNIPLKRKGSSSATSARNGRKQAKKEETGKVVQEATKDAPKEAKKESKITTYNIRENVVDEYVLYGLDKKVTRAPQVTSQKQKSPIPYILVGVGLVLILVITIVAMSGGKRTGEYVTDSRPEDSTSPKSIPATGGSTGETVKSPFDNPWTQNPAGGAGTVEQPASGPSQVSETPKERPWMKLFEEVVNYKQRNPDDYRGVKEKFADILRKYEEKMEWNDRNRIMTEQERWEEEWRKKAEKAFDEARNKVNSASSIEEKIKIWESFPKLLLDVGDTKKKVDGELKLLSSVKEAFNKFPEYIKRAEEMLAKKDFLGAGTILNEWESEYVEPFDDGTEEGEKILALLSKEREEIKNFRERINKEYEAYLEASRKEPPKPTPGEEEQPTDPAAPWKNWEAYKKFLEQTFARLDSDAQNSELSPGSSSAVTRIARAGQGIELNPVQGQGMEVSNNGVSDGWVYPAFKKVYLWETYTFTVRIKVVSGEARIGLRMNYTQQGLRGGAFKVPGGSDWTELKFEVDKDKVEIYVNGQRRNPVQLSADNPPVGFPAIIVAPNGKVICGNWEVNLKTVRK